MKTINILAVLCLSILISGLPVSASPKPNVHNTHDCLFCHADTPRFGIDTKETVTFRKATWDDPAMCMNCHKAEENLHPLRVIPGEGTKETTLTKLLPLGSSPGLEKMVICETCHFIHAADSDHALLRGFPGAQKPGLFPSWQNLCKECHAQNLQKNSPHAGDQESCSFCHMATPKKGQPTSVAPRGIALCNFCHGGIQNKHFEKANPFTEDVTCSDCHDPHLGQDHPARLRISYLETVKDMVTIDPHYRKSLCFTCHKEGPNYPLLAEDPSALCNRCHGTGKIAGDSHPIKTVPTGMAVPQGWPLKNGSLTCLTCHRAGHNDDRPFYKFLRGGPYENKNAFCFLCHDRDAFSEINPHLDINNLKGCEFCHIDRPVLGTDKTQKMRFLSDINLLCLRCHDYIPHPAMVSHTLPIPSEMAEIIPPDYPLDENSRITCATCHNPHVGDDQSYKLRGAMTGMEICGNCHRF